MIIRTDPKLIKAYFEDDSRLSQSKIKLLLQGVDIFNKDETDEKKLYYEEKGHFIYGNAVDMILTQGEERFNEEYAVMLVEKPGPKLMSTLHRIYDTFIIGKEIDQVRSSTMQMDITNSEIIDAANAEEYQRNWSGDKIVENIKKSADYFDALCLNHGKQLVSVEENTTIRAVAESLKTNELTKFLFETDQNRTPEHLKIFFQVPIYFIFDGVLCKALLDMVVVDTVGKTITPYDLKTLGDYTINFLQSVMRNRYDIQGAFYHEALRSAMEDENHIFSEFVNYRVEQFRFVVESTISQGNPLIYECDPELMMIGMYGRPGGYTHLYDYSQNPEVPQHDVYHKPIHGIKDGIELFKYHEENGYEKDLLVIENSGILTLNWNQIY